MACVKHVNFELTHWNKIVPDRSVVVARYNVNTPLTDGIVNACARLVSARPHELAQAIDVMMLQSLR